MAHVESNHSLHAKHFQRLMCSGKVNKGTLRLLSSSSSQSGGVLDLDDVINSTTSLPHTTRDILKEHRESLLWWIASMLKCPPCVMLLIESALLVDAINASFPCSSIVTKPLFAVWYKEVLFIRRGDSLAMAMYALAVRPLIGIHIVPM